MRLQTLLQRPARAVQAHHRVVVGDAQLDRDLLDGSAIDDHAAEDRRIFGLERLRLNAHAPAIDGRTVRYGRKFEIVYGKEWRSSIPELVDQDVADNPV